MGVHSGLGIDSMVEGTIVTLSLATPTKILDVSDQVMDVNSLDLVNLILEIPWTWWLMLLSLHLRVFKLLMRLLL